MLFRSAERLAARGLAAVLPEADLTADTLLRAMAARRAAPPPGDHGFDLEGAARSVTIAEALHADRNRLSRRGAAHPGSDPLDRALDRAASHGRSIALAWRDDDAVTATPALDRLIALSEAHAVPLLLAAIPAGIEPALGRRIAEARNVRVAVHGLAHRNHAPPDAKPAEFGAHRPFPDLVADAAAGLRIARERLHGPALLPVFVPPWNRLAPDFAAALPGLGYRGLSSVPGAAVPGLRRLDATLDPIDWRGSRSLRDPEAILQALAADIEREPGRPVGLLTHHLAHDAAIWSFVEALLARLAKHPAIRILDPRDVFDDAAMDTNSPAPHSSVSQIARTG